MEKINQLIDKNTEYLSAWNEIRGNFKERVFHRHQFAYDIVQECMDLLILTGSTSFTHLPAETYAKVLSDHFELDKWKK